MKNKICYILFVLVTLFYSVMYEGIFLPVLLVFELFLALVLFLLTFFLAGNIQFKLEMNHPVMSKGDEVFINLVAVNKGWLPINHFLVEFGLENGFVNGNDRNALKGAIQGNSEIRLALKVSSRYCGRINISVDRVRVYDYLRLFYRNKKTKSTVSLNVLPNLHQVVTEITEKTRRFSVDSEEYEAHRSGDDPSEIYQVREFRNGDTMQRVHWKLSARTDEWMTKEFSMPKGCKVLLLVDLHCDDLKMATAEWMDTLLEAAVSLSFGMTNAECPHFVGWFDERHNGIVRKQVEGEEDFYEMMEELLGAGLYSQEYDLYAGYNGYYPGSVFSTVLTLGVNLCLNINGQEERAFTSDQLKEELEGYLLRV